MNQRQLITGLAALILVLCRLLVTYGQAQPLPPPAPIPAVQYVPVTVFLDLDAVAAKFLQGQPPPGQVPPMPPPRFQGRRPIFRGGLLNRLRQRQPIRRLVAAGIARRKEIGAALGKISEPVNVGDDRWLSLNIKEVVLRGADVQALGPGARAVVALAVQMEPTIVLSKEKPAPMPLPKITLGKALPPPSPTGTPINFFLVVDPKSTPQVLGGDSKKELAKYGIDPTKVKFSQEVTKDKQKVILTVPMKKPLEANLKIWFSPKIKDNILSFVNPDCEVLPPSNAKKDEKSLNQTLQQFTRKAIRTFVLAEMKKETVDLRPHLKKLSKLPVNKAAADKVRAPISNLRVTGMAAQNNHLIVRIRGHVGRQGIVILAP